MKAKYNKRVVIIMIQNTEKKNSKQTKFPSSCGWLMGKQGGFLQKKKEVL